MAGVGAGAGAGRDLVRDCASIGGKYQLTRLQAALRAVAPDCCGVFVRADPRLRQTQCDCSRPQTDDLCRAICCCLDALPIVRHPPPALLLPAWNPDSAFLSAVSAERASAANKVGVWGPGWGWGGVETRRK